MQHPMQIAVKQARENLDQVCTAAKVVLDPLRIIADQLNVAGVLNECQITHHEGVWSVHVIHPINAVGCGTTWYTAFDSMLAHLESKLVVAHKS